MTNRTAMYRSGRLALPIAGIALLLGTLFTSVPPVRAASSIDIEARPLVGGRYAVGGWMAIAVTLVNDGEPTSGDLAASTEEGAVQRFVEMPAGARKIVMLYVKPEAFQRRITVQYREPNGTVETEVEVRVLEQSSNQVAIVGDGGGTLRPQLTGVDDLGTPEPLTLGVADIPERSEPLDGLSGIVWADDSSSLSEAQRRAMERWVAGGGQLVVIGGPDWQARTAGFTDLLPMTDLASIDGVSQSALADWAGSEAAPADDATVSAGPLRDDARAVIRADDDTVLAAMRTIGAGRVVLVGSDLATDAYRGWEGSPSLWARLMPSGALLEQFFGGFPIAEEAENAMGNALGSLPSLDVPPAELLLIVIVGYILLIGPISYLVLRRADRRELAWVSAPLLVLVFTACSYGIGTTLKGSAVVINQISLIRSSTAGGAATVESYAGIFSPDRASYDLTVEADALMSRLTPNTFDGRPRATTSEVVVDQGDPAHLRGLAIGVFGFEAVRADSLVEYEPALSISWRSEGGDTIGTVTNNGETTVTDVAYVSSSGGDMIARELAPGASAEFEVGVTNFNGSSAGDQVYGFGGFDNQTEEQRRIQTRRQVIDSLVGYGGWMPGIELGTGAARGPYLLGWHDAPGPVPVDVDGVTATRYAQSVEVLSVRPSLGPGEATIRPAQMAVAIVNTEGETSNAGPGMVMLGDGSVTYSVALPLEATNMRVSELTIIIGPDPSMVLSDQGGGFGGGFWPQGFTIEVRDPDTGEWELLGDINERSRWEIDDPASAISDTGRIEVRVTGIEVDPMFGQASVFVSAEAVGVIGE